MATVDQAVATVAKQYKIPYANLRAVVEIESNGVVYATVNGKSEPLIRWEGHIFDRRLTPEEKETARNRRLASPKVGGIANPNSQQKRWDDLLIPASKINRQAAHESCSWGLGQVMCFHWQAFGYKSFEDFVAIARSGVGGQIELMMKYCIVNDLVDELQRGDFTAFARAYNGPGFAKNKYDTKMRDAAKRYAKDGYISDVYAPTADVPPLVIDTTTTAGMYKLGSTGRIVREIQALLLRAGQAIKIDGDYGPSTKAAVKALQKKHKLTVDGVVGPETWRALDSYRVEGEPQPGGAAVTQTPQGRQGLVAAIIGALVAGLANLTPEAAQAITATIGGIIAAIGGLWAAWGYKKAND